MGLVLREQAPLPPREGNPHWPLPADYMELGPEAQARARRIAVSQVSTPEDAVRSWEIFCDYYLNPDEDGEFDPWFYKPPVRPRPPLHAQMCRWLFRHRRMAIGAPRYSAKSTWKKSVVVWLSCICERFTTVLVFAKDDFVLREFSDYKYQFENNTRLIADFGQARPGKGERLWNNHTLQMNWGSEIVGVTVEGRSRGLRPDLVIPDDVEFDDDYKGKNKKINLQDLKEKYLRVLLPMMGPSGMMACLGTMVSKNSLHYHMVCTNDDDRFKSVEDGGTWFKINLPAEDAHGNNIWPEHYTKSYLAQLKQEMGVHYNTEMMGQPTSESDAPFKLTDRHKYTSYPAEAILHDPWGQTTVTAPENGEWGAGLQTQPLGKLLGTMRRVITVDYASSLDTSADYSAIVVAGLDPLDRLWVLDCWQGRVRSEQLAQQVWKMAERWKVHRIGVEAIGAQMEVVRVVRQAGMGRDNEKWLPTVQPLKYPMTLSKEDRIMALEWRFVQGKLLFPADRAGTGYLAKLYEQITEFTPDGRGLQHDDLVDSLAMVQFLMRGHAAATPEHVESSAPIDKLMSGQLFIEGTTTPMIHCIDPTTLRPDQLKVIMELTEEYNAAIRQAQLSANDLSAFRPPGSDHLDDYIL